jgi:hypothetical protein
VAIDLIVSTSRYSGISEGKSTKLGTYNMEYGFKAWAIGPAPAVGIKYRPFRHFSVTAEASLSSIYYKTSASSSYPSESDMAVLVNPLRVLSFNYHF